MGGARSEGVGGVGPEARSFQDIYPFFISGKRVLCSNEKKGGGPKGTSTKLLYVKPPYCSCSTAIGRTRPEDGLFPLGN